MIILTKNGNSYDTEIDLTAPERHILQKLLIWKDLAADLNEFRQKTREAFQKGWNNSGPISPGTALVTIISDLDEKVRIRLRETL
ncbi:MAG: hypothetical protein HY787_24120 [Deltaproteobacteria bacterium]|nr:hypothetical protein [Deltaproteobacteria bacterium]